MGDAELLLLVYYHEPEIPEPDPFPQQLVGSYRDVDGTVFETPQYLLFLHSGDEARERLHPDGTAVQSFERARVVLAREKGGGGQQHRLLSVKRRLEGGAKRDFRLSEPHVSAYQPVHGSFRLHVAHHVLYGGRLVGRLAPRKRHFELAERPVPGREPKSLLELSLGVELDQVLRHPFHGPGDPSHRSFPAGASELLDPRGSASRVFLHEVGLFHRDEHLVAVPVFALEKLPRSSPEGKPAKTPEYSNAALPVNHVVPGPQAGEGGEKRRRRVARLPRGGARGGFFEQAFFREKGCPEVVKRGAFEKLPDHVRDPPARPPVGELLELLPLLSRGKENEDVVAPGGEIFRFFGKRRHRRLPKRHGPGREPHNVSLPRRLRHARRSRDLFSRELRLKLLLRQVELPERREGPRESPERALSRLELLPEPFQRPHRVEFPRKNDYQVFGRIVEQAVFSLPEKRREPLFSPEAAALLHVPKQRFRLARGEPPLVGRAQQPFPGGFGVISPAKRERGRGHGRRPDLSRRFLGGGGKLPDGIHAVVEKLHPGRKFRARGEQVDYSSPHAHLSPSLRELRLPVADPGKSLDERVPSSFRPGLHGEALGLEVGGGGRRLEQRGGLGEEHPRFLPPREGVDSLGFGDFPFLEKRAAFFHSPRRENRRPRSPDGGDGDGLAPALLPVFADAEHPRAGRFAEKGDDESRGVPAKAHEVDGTFAEGAEQFFDRGIAREGGESDLGSFLVQRSGPPWRVLRGSPL